MSCEILKEKKLKIYICSKLPNIDILPKKTKFGALGVNNVDFHSIT